MKLLIALILDNNSHLIQLYGLSFYKYPFKREVSKCMFDGRVEICLAWK